MSQDKSVRIWFDFAKKLLETGTRIFQQIIEQMSEKDADDETRILALLLLCRSINNLTGILALVRDGLVVEARTIVRCSLENLFFVEGLRQQGNKFVKEMYGDELASRRHRAQSLLRRKRTPLGNTEWNTEWETRLRDLLRAAKNAEPKFLCFADVARSGTAANLYVFYSQLSADAAHPTTHALSRHLTSINSNGEPMFGIDVQPVPSENQLADTLDLACTAALGVLLNVTAILGHTAANLELTQALSEHKALQRLKPAEKKDEKTTETS